MQLEPIYRSANNFYPTPAPVTERLLAGLTVRPGDTLLEPSAGKGDMAAVIRRHYPDNRLDVVEIHPGLRQALAAQAFTLAGSDIFQVRTSYDVVIGNPPFCSNFQDVHHFMHGWKLLKPGGRIAMVLHEYSVFPVYHSGKPGLFREFLDLIDARTEKIGCAFAQGERPTNTRIALVWAEKPEWLH